MRWAIYKRGTGRTDAPRTITPCRLWYRNILDNHGGVRDNVKKYIESGAHGRKKSDAHKAAVIGNMIGGPFKDTARPLLHVLIKLLATLTLVLASLFI